MQFWYGKPLAASCNNNDRLFFGASLYGRSAKTKEEGLMNVTYILRRIIVYQSLDNTEYFSKNFITKGEYFSYTF